MQIYLTYDYELFFGTQAGTADSCIIEPTNLIRRIAQRTGIKMTFFIDVGYLKKLLAYKDMFPRVADEYQKIASQIRDLIKEGHDCQLHIHPHWEDCQHDGNEWKMITDRYKLDDFSDLEIEQIVLEYQQILKDHTGQEVTSYRAGGWCLQPFDRIKPSFQKAGIRIDSTVFPGGKFVAGNYSYDFSNNPEKNKWKFSYDLIKEDKNGMFWEYPISNYFYSPFFFWRLFILGRLKPRQHKPMGNGYPMFSPGLRKKMLTRGMNLSASVDGYFITKLGHVLTKNGKKGYEDMVVLGHPKACTRYALRRLEKFIVTNRTKHQFLTFSDINP